MSKQERQHQDEQATEQRGQAAQPAASLPATAMVQAMLENGRADPKAVAAIVGANPRASHEIFTLLNRTVGNRFASEVLQLATSSNFEVAPPTDFAEMRRAAHAAAPDKESTAAVAMLDANFEVTPPDDLDAVKQAMDEVAPEEPTHAAPPKNKQSWVAKAQRYNLAHPLEVAQFLEITGNLCIDETTGEPDPRKIARWQVKHGVAPDGRVGSDTITTAIIKSP